MQKSNVKMDFPHRAALLAHAGFFPQRFVFGKVIFAEIAVNEYVVHSVVINSESRNLYCTCPFRPKPCIHALALNALFEREGEAAFEPAEKLPEWVDALLKGLPACQIRSGRSVEVSATAKEKTRFERLERAARGFDDLENWLLDAARRGVAALVSEDTRWWEGIAARMADASMTGLSRTLRLLGQIPPDAPDWAEQTAAVLADCYLAVRAFRKRDSLPESLLFDLQNFIGINIKKEEVVASGERVLDVWAVASQIEEPIEDKLSARRTWLLGGKTGRYALLLDHSYGNAGFPPGFSPGSIEQGPLVFYPSTFPLRALVPDALTAIPKKIEKLPGHPDFESFAQAWAAALALQPWLQIFPAAFEAVIPQEQSGRFFIADKNRKIVGLNVAENAGWRLLALSGGHPISLFGEWNGRALKPLSVLAEGRFVSGFSLAGLKEV